MHKRSTLILANKIEIPTVPAPTLAIKTTVPAIYAPTPTPTPTDTPTHTLTPTNTSQPFFLPAPGTCGGGGREAVRLRMMDKFQPSSRLSIANESRTGSHP